MNNPRITWKGVGWLAGALVLSYLATQLVREASKEMFVSASLLGGLLTLAAHTLPEPPPGN